MAKGDGAKRALTELEIDTGNGSFTVDTWQAVWFHMWRALAFGIKFKIAGKCPICKCKGSPALDGACFYCLHDCGDLDY